VQQGQRHSRRSAAFCPLTLMFSALASGLIDALVAIKVLKVSSKGSSHPGIWIQGNMGGCELTACLLQPDNWLYKQRQGAYVCKKGVSYCKVISE